MDSQNVRNAVVEALEEIKAKDVEVLDARHLTALFDYLIIASADSTRQTRALARNVEDKLREQGVISQGVEGLQSGEWILVDLGSVVVHIMQPAVRDFYNLSELWGGPVRQPSRRPVP